MTEDSLNKLPSGFIEHNHFQVVEIEEGQKAIMKVRITKEALNPYGYAHGGLIFSLGDTTMGLVARSTGRKAVTHNCAITYLRPTLGEELTAIAEMIKDGKRTCFLRCNFYDDENKLTATMDGNYFYID